MAEHGIHHESSIAAPLRTMHPLIESHRHQLVELARRHGIVDVRVFGSMARGTADDNSDVDLLVNLAPGVSGLALGSLLLDAQDLLGRRVDVVTETGLHPAMREQVLRDALPL
jgi:predicted nucleotidyltransferase